MISRLLLLGFIIRSLWWFQLLLFYWATLIWQNLLSGVISQNFFGFQLVVEFRNFHTCQSGSKNILLNVWRIVFQFISGRSYRRVSQLIEILFLGRHLDFLLFPLLRPFLFPDSLTGGRRNKLWRDLSGFGVWDYESIYVVCDLLQLLYSVVLVLAHQYG